VVDVRFEKRYLRMGFTSVAGVDEVGRGALFGPVLAVAMSFPPEILLSPPPWTKEINDSKLLSPTKRLKVAHCIIRACSSLGIGVASNVEIDEKNIYRASLTAMERAVGNMSPSPGALLVDGFPLKELKYPQMGIVQGDRKSLSIAAASIVAKVMRDGLMTYYDTVYRGYGLSRNKGYGTGEHFRALREKGPTHLHRLSFNLGLEDT